MALIVDDVQRRGFVFPLITATKLRLFVICDSSSVLFMKGCIYKPQRMENIENKNRRVVPKVMSNNFL